ncbi:hypothetical protein ACVILJ_005583 [Bradyrhizobium diazoefficiens]
MQSVSQVRFSTKVIQMSFRLRVSASNAERRAGEPCRAWQDDQARPNSGFSLTPTLRESVANAHLAKKHPRRSRWMEPQGCRNELDKKPAASAKERLLDAGTVGGTTPSAVVPAKAGTHYPTEESLGQMVTTCLRKTAAGGNGSWLSPGRRWGGISLQQLSQPRAKPPKPPPPRSTAPPACAAAPASASMARAFPRLPADAGPRR